MNPVFFPDRDQPTDGIGGKARNLLDLERLGLVVPRWLVVQTAAPAGSDLAIEDPNDCREYIENYKWESSLLGDIQAYFGRDWMNKTYAVRSSALAEDGAMHSFAGQFQSFLHVKPDQLLSKLTAVWLSCLTPEVTAYRQRQGLPLSIEMGIIVQEMVDAEVSGVAFGIDPVKGNTDVQVISSVYGLGEGLVSGLLDADHYEVKGQEVSASIRHKAYALHRNEQGNGVSQQTVPSALTDKPSLSNEQVLKVSAVLTILEDHFHRPQDIEFAFQKGQLLLLQTRPVTTQPKEDYTLWDNSNIVESYPGITTPLTFSFISKMYERVYRQFVGLLGVQEQEIEHRKSIFQNTLGLVRGRVYYNLVSWYKMLALLPGYSLNAEYMEQMMGVKERFELEAGHIMTKGMARIRLIQMVFKMIRLHLGLNHEKARFQKHLDQVIHDYQNTDWDALSVSEIQERYQNFETSLLLEWKAPLINDFFAMIWFGVFRKQIEKHFPDHPNLHNDLLCGSQDIISTAPIRETMAIAKAITADERADLLFRDAEPEDIWTILQSGPYEDLLQRINAYLATFGERCVGELKLETISLQQDPTQFIRTLKSYVEQGLTQPGNAQAGVDQQMKAAAEEVLERSVKKRPILRRVLHWMMKNTRKMVSDRENLRFERTRGFGMVRTMFTALGQKWHADGQLQNARDVFYLTLEEVRSASGITPELQQQIEDRKKEFLDYQEQAPPQPRFFTYGKDFSDAYVYATDKLQEASDQLQGIGCCPGKVKGVARVIHHPSEAASLEGDILITTSTDPGWVTLFPSASAIIVERGSLLSHSAIVAREMGIPCIVGVEGLMNSVKTGDELLMDGSTGELAVLHPEPVLS